MGLKLEGRLATGILGQAGLVEEWERVESLVWWEGTDALAGGLGEKCFEVRLDRAFGNGHVPGSG
jgi:hypothetical protein